MNQAAYVRATAFSYCENGKWFVVDGYIYEATDEKSANELVEKLNLFSELKEKLWKSFHGQIDDSEFVYFCRTEIFKQEN